MRRTLTAFLTATLALSYPLAAHAEELILLHTNDIHNRLLSFEGRDGRDVGGLDRLAELIAQHRAKHPNVLVLDGGDVFQGTPLYTFFKGEVDFKAMSQVGYDVGTLGNHDLDDGWANLKKQLSHVGYPILCANVTNADGTPVLLPAMTFKRGQTRIGVVGLLGETAWENIAAKQRQGLKYQSITDAARHWVTAMRPQVDLLVLLTHNGFAEDQELAQAVAGIDVIVGGHSHTPVPEPKLVKTNAANGIGGTLIVQAGSYGQHLGRLTLDVDKGRITSYSGTLLAVDHSIKTPREAVKGIVAPYAAQVSAQMAEVIGHAPQALPTSGKYAGETPLGNWLADMVKEAGGAEVGIINSGGIRAELPAGPVTVGRVFEILPFENYVVSFEAPGREIAELVQTTVERLHKRQSGTMQVAGIQFTAKDGRLVGPIQINGKNLDPAKTYRVAAIDYLLGGSEGKFFSSRRQEKQFGLLRDTMLDRVRRQKTVLAPTSGRIVIQDPSSAVTNR